MKISDRFPCSLPEAGRAGSLNGVRVLVGPGVRREGWLRCSAHPFGVVCVGGMHSTLLSLPPFKGPAQSHLGSEQGNLLFSLPPAVGSCSKALLEFLI